MDIDFGRIDSQLNQLRNVAERAETVIKNSQSFAFPYTALNHAHRIFCAILAAQAKELAERAAKQVGLELKASESEDRQSVIAKFLSESAEWTGTDSDSMTVARVNAQESLLKVAQDMVARAERVLERDETMSGQPISHGPLWDK